MSAPQTSAVLNKIRFNTSDMALTHELKARVDGYFSSRNLSKHADARMVAKSVFFFGSVLALLALLISGVLPWGAALAVCFVLGAFNAFIGFNIGHDAIHGAYSDKPWVNALLSRSFDFVGASSFTWSTAHNFVHHTYTNVPGVDHDLEPGPFLLFYEREKPGFVYRFQHVYSWALYMFASLAWLYKKDFQQVFAPDPRSGKRAPTKTIVDMIAWKVGHLALFVGAPVLIGGYAWWMVALGYLAIHAATGTTLAIVFQLAHVVEKTAFPRPNDALRIEDPWMAHQLKTTANFAPDSWLANFFCGGLNHQVEHHLFSKICHIHYSEIAPIVKEVARKHGVPYHEYPTFLAALGSHLRTMKRFGHPAQKAAQCAAQQPVVDDVSDALPAE